MNPNPHPLEEQPAAQDELQAFAVPDGLTPKAPVAGNWTQLAPPEGAPPHTDFYEHVGNRIGVVSTFAQVSGDQIAHLLSMGKKGGRRVTTTEAQMVLQQFGICDAAEVQLPGQEHDYQRNFIASTPAT